MPRPDQRCRCTEIRRPHYYGDHYTPPAEPTQEDGPAVSAEQGTTRLGLVESTELMLEIGRNVSAAPITAANYVLPALCECDKFLHEPGKPRCTNEPEDYGTVRSSPALCTRCLFYCYNDDDPF